jgi:hypothetical protein
VLHALAHCRGVETYGRSSNPPTHPFAIGGVTSRVNDKRDSLLENLDQTIVAFAAMRTPDAVCTAAFDTLKQARAMIARALAAEVQSCRSSPFHSLAGNSEHRP